MNHPDTDLFVGEIFSKCYLDSSDGLLDRTQTELQKRADRADQSVLFLRLLQLWTQSVLQSKVLVQKVGGVIRLLDGQLFRKELLPSIQSHKMCIVRNFLPFECFVYTLSTGNY